MFSAVVDAYRRTRKPHDIIWNRFVARPLAAVLLVPLRATSITPNQVTFASLAVFAAAIALMVLWPGYWGLVAAAGVLELSYVLDCVDGQLARWKGLSSPVGAHLDFLMDELKAFLLVPAVGVRLWQASGCVCWLLTALGGAVIVASAISLTTFLRRPEYAAATGASGSRGSGDYGEGFGEAKRRSWRSPITWVEAVGRFVIHYPSYIFVLALAGRIEWFMYAYLAFNAAYAGRSLLGITLALGRTRQRT